VLRTIVGSQTFLAKILKYAAEALVEDGKLDRFAAVESNALRIFPQAH